MRVFILPTRPAERLPLSVEFQLLLSVALQTPLHVLQDGTRPMHPHFYFGGRPAR